MLFAREVDGFLVFTYNNIYLAYLDCRKNKRNKRSALEFEINAEQNLLELTEELSVKTYRSKC